MIVRLLWLLGFVWNLAVTEDLYVQVETLKSESFYVAECIFPGLIWTACSIFHFVNYHERAKCSRTIWGLIGQLYNLHILLPSFFTMIFLVVVVVLSVFQKPYQYCGQGVSLVKIKHLTNSEVRLVMEAL